ncbi:hypothetical protein N7659_03240 [Streptococcus sp. CSL10205-OR2]|nr:hypothetical protein [Streptococcus sp. CSL10205-OR2]
MFSLNQEKTDTQENLAEQQYALETSIAKMFVSDYEDVKEIEFTKWLYSSNTSSWYITVIINNDNEINLSFDSLLGLEELSSSVFSSETFKLIKKSGIENPMVVNSRLESIQKTSLEGVKIIYSKNQKED